MNAILNSIWSVVSQWKAGDWLMFAGLVVSLALGLHLIDATQAAALGSTLGGLIQSIAGVIAGVILLAKILRQQQRVEMARYAELHSRVSASFDPGVIAGSVGPETDVWDHGVTSAMPPAIDPADCDKPKGA